MHIEGVKPPPLEVMKGTGFNMSSIHPGGHIRMPQVYTNTDYHQIK